MMKYACILFCAFMACIAVVPAAGSESAPIEAAAPKPADNVFSFPFSKWKGPTITVWGYMPTGVDIQSAPILVMMHGNTRNTQSYMKAWAPLAQEKGVIVIAPNFDNDRFPGSRRYNLGYVFDGKGKRRKEAKWTFSAIDPLFEFFKEKIGNTQSEYTLYGHSAGSQFVHRFMYYKPEAKVKRFLMANAGWYTLPDMEEPYPYGLKGAAVSEDDLKAALGRDVVILLGDEDVNTNHSSLRRTEEAMRQGPHRFARGQNFYRAATEKAKAYDTALGWSVKIVPGVAHSNGGIAKEAIEFVD